MNQYIHCSIHKCVHVLSKNAEGKTHDKSGSLLEELCQSKFSKVYAREKVFFIGFIWRLQTKVQHLDMSPAWPFETSIRMGWGLSRKNLANNGHSSWMKIAFLLLIKKECGIFVWNSQGAAFHAHRSERLWFADCRHIFYFSKKKRHVKRKSS